MLKTKKSKILISAITICSAMFIGTLMNESAYADPTQAQINFSRDMHREATHARQTGQLERAADYYMHAADILYYNGARDIETGGLYRRAANAYYSTQQYLSARRAEWMSLSCGA